jgi:hypothetical protein
MQNQADRRCWAARLKEEAQTAEADHRLAAEGEAEHCQLALEEHKKNKSKYTPVRDADVPSNPVIFPCQYVVRKMKSEEYCELFYFTNSGLKEASCSTFSADTDTLIMMTCHIPDSRPIL